MDTYKDFRKIKLLSKTMARKVSYGLLMFATVGNISFAGGVSIGSSGGWFGGFDGGYVGGVANRSSIVADHYTETTTVNNGSVHKNCLPNISATGNVTITTTVDPGSLNQDDNCGGDTLLLGAYGGRLIGLGSGFVGAVARLTVVDPTSSNIGVGSVGGQLWAGTYLTNQSRVYLGLGPTWGKYSQSSSNKNKNLWGGMVSVGWMVPLKRSTFVKLELSYNNTSLFSNTENVNYDNYLSFNLGIGFGV